MRVRVLRRAATCTERLVPAVSEAWCLRMVHNSKRRCWELVGCVCVCFERKHCSWLCAGWMDGWTSAAGCTTETLSSWP